MADPGLSSTEAASSFEPANAATRQLIDADKIDLPPVAATCAPEDLVDDDTKDLLAHISGSFPTLPVGRSSIRIGAKERGEYLKVLSAMHRCGKLGFMRAPMGVASFFVVGNAGKDRQRPIWNGAEISTACARPPLPPRLGNPAAFLDICVSAGKRLYF